MQLSPFCSLSLHHVCSYFLYHRHHHKSILYCLSVPVPSLYPLSTLTSFCSPFSLLAQTISVIWYRSLSPPLNIYIFLTWNFVHHTLLIFFLPIWLLLLSLLCWKFVSPTLKCYRPLTLRWSYTLQWPSTHAMCWRPSDFYFQNESFLWIVILCSRMSNGCFDLCKSETGPLIHLPTPCQTCFSSRDSYYSSYCHKASYVKNLVS